MKRLFPIIAFLLLTNLLYSQTKPQTNLFLQTLDAAPGDQVCVDFTVTDFRFIEALGLSIRWDTSALQFTEYIISPGVSLTPNALNVLDEEGVLLMAWTIIPSVSLPDNSSILQLCFTVKETDISKFAYIAFDDRITPDVIVPEDLTGNPFVNAVFHSGGIQIKPNGNDVTIAAQTVALDDCIGRQTSIDLTVTGGAPPYNFEWTGPNNFLSTDEDLEQLAEGYYEVSVYDQNGLQATGRFLINVLENESEGVLFIEEAIVTPTDCNAWEGSIQLNMVGETSAYTYSWNNGARTNSLSNLPSGDYAVTIANDQGCEQIKNFAVEGFGNIIYNQISKDLSCDGSPAEIGVLMPNPDLFLFEWDTNEFTSMIEVEEAGNYYLTINNGTYCLETVEFNIKYDVSTFNVDLRLRAYFTCEEEDEGLATYIHAEMLNGGNPPYYFSWNNGVRDTSYFRSRLPFDNTQGTYSVSIEDQSGRQTQWSFQQTELYGCGPDSSAVFFEAPHMIVAPGSQFVYPVSIHQNFDSLARALFTIDWDNCLLKADSIVLYYPTRMSFADINLFNGTYEVYFQAPPDTILPDTLTIAEIFFQVPQGAEGISPFLFSINEPAYNFNEETAFLRPLHGSITVASQQALVLPGDADHDYSVNHFDLLSLGLFYQNSGPERRLGLLQEQEYGIPWLLQTYESRTNLKHLDCNGDGLINAQDTNIIAMNWDVSNMAIEKSLHYEEGPAVFVTGDTLLPGEKQQLSIQLGEIDQPAVNVYGIALTIDYEEESVLPESVYIDFVESWLATNSEVPPLVISRNDPLNHRIHLAIVRADGENITGYGELAKLHLTTRADTDNRTAAFTVTDVRLINSLEEFIPTNHQTSFLTIDQMTATQEPDLASYIKLYPVPTQDRLFIRHTPEISILQAAIFDLNGRQIQEEQYMGNHLDVAHFSPGIYFLKLVTNKGMVTKRWVKK